jgi:hypothetical protein
MPRRTLLAIVAALVLAVLALASPGLAGAVAEEASPFDKLSGRWMGEGRLGIKQHPTETVKCRVTYAVHEDGIQMRQAIRCATQSGSVEIVSTVVHVGGLLSGTWKETTRDWGGDLNGTVTPHGFKVQVRGENVSANMEIIVKDTRQIIEIQFQESSLIGLTLILTKG